MISKNGEIFEFNIFSTTLGFSRLHNFVYSKTKTREDVERCLMTTFKYMNGVPKNMLTDNMRAVVDINGGKRKVNPEFAQFAKDIGTSVTLCKPNARIMSSYLVNVEKSKVYPDSLIYYKGKRYSVNPRYIDQYVQAKQIDNILYIYHNKQLIATHEITNKIINYTEEHYSEGLKLTMPYKEDNKI